MAQFVPELEKFNVVCRSPIQKNEGCNHMTCKTVSTSVTLLHGTRLTERINQGPPLPPCLSGANFTTLIICCLFVCFYSVSMISAGCVWTLGTYIVTELEVTSRESRARGNGGQGQLGWAEARSWPGARG